MLSFAAILLLLVLILVSPTPQNKRALNDRAFIAGFFIACCLFGMSFAFFPGWLRKYFKDDYYQLHSKKKQIKTQHHYKGHHPDCEQFKTHTLIIKKKIWCAGCLGLAIGSIFSMFLALLFVFFMINWHIATFYVFFFLGFIIIVFTFGEIMVPVRYTFLHIILNSGFIIGFFLIAISGFEITGNILYGLLAILFSFLWLDTRIQLSHRQHSNICKTCNESCKMY
jgi:hypothetical protein